MRSIPWTCMLGLAALFVCHSASAQKTKNPTLSADAALAVKNPYDQFLKFGRIARAFTNRKDGSRLVVVGPKPDQIEPWQKAVSKLRFSSHGDLNTVNENILFYQPSGNKNQFEYQMVAHVMKTALRGRMFTGPYGLEDRYVLAFKDRKAMVACPDDNEGDPLTYIQDDAARASVAALWNSGKIKLSVNYPADHARIERVFVAVGNDLFIQTHTWATNQRFMHHIHHGKEIESGEALLDRGVSPPGLNATKIGSIRPLFEYNSIPMHAGMADENRDENSRRRGGTGVFSFQTPSGEDHNVIEVPHLSDYTGPIYKLRLTTPDGRVLRLDNGESEAGKNPSIVTLVSPCASPAKPLELAKH